jgi:hypothetical protein
MVEFVKYFFISTIGLEEKYLPDLLREIGKSKTFNYLAKQYSRY